jgi:hypothetical protein
VSRDRLLVIDADMPKRLAPALELRARRVVTASKLKLAENVKDAELLRGLAALFNGKEEWVLVTGDDRMPLEHGPVITETRATLAVIHPEVPVGLMQHSWRVDVVQRHAHTMQRQQPQTVRRYTIGGSTVWTPRRRHLIEMAREGWIPWSPQRSPEDPEPPPLPEPSPPTLWDQE